VLSSALLLVLGLLTCARDADANRTEPFVCNGRYKGGIKPTGMLDDLLRRHADLCGADLRGFADLQHVNLTGANRTGADLTGADLTDTDLNHARFILTKMKGSSLYGANVFGTKFDVDINSFPDAGGMAYAENLPKLTFERSDAALEKLRTEFKTEGLHTQARQLSYFIPFSPMAQIPSDL
jgi:hypothetical protein